MSDQLQDHPIASIFPLLGEEELAELAADIQAHGMQVPIVLFEGKILDGRNRYRAAQRVGAHVLTNYYTGESATSHVLSLNLKRRQLTASQKAAAAEEARPHFAAEAQLRMAASQFGSAAPAILPEPDKGEARDKAAELTGASPRYVQDAKKLKEEEPEIFEEVKEGKLTIPAAKRKAKAKKAAAEPSAEPAKGTAIPANGMQYARLAIAQLEKINGNDSQRQTALDHVAKWISKQTK